MKFKKGQWVTGMMDGDMHIGQIVKVRENNYKVRYRAPAEPADVCMETHYAMVEERTMMLAEYPYLLLHFMKDSMLKNMHKSGLKMSAEDSIDSALCVLLESIAPSIPRDPAKINELTAPSTLSGDNIVSSVKMAIAVLRMQSAEFIRSHLKASIAYENNRDSCTI